MPCEIAKLIPTKRELKLIDTCFIGVYGDIAKLIPTKRELKRYRCAQPGGRIHQIAKLIPTKRELKRQRAKSDRTQPDIYCKAHPDEKGIETSLHLS